jgi:hypothetical protein
LSCRNFPASPPPMAKMMTMSAINPPIQRAVRLLRLFLSRFRFSFSAARAEGAAGFHFGSTGGAATRPCASSSLACWKYGVGCQTCRPALSAWTNGSSGDDCSEL